MAKPELGLKRTCVACGAKFYDLTRTPVVCPKCGTEQPAEQPRVRRATVEEKPKKRVVAPEAEAEDLEIEVDDADETIDDAEELDDDADEAISEEIEVTTDRDEET